MTIGSETRPLASTAPVDFGDDGGSLRAPPPWLSPPPPPPRRRRRRRRFLLGSAPRTERSFLGCSSTSGVLRVPLVGGKIFDVVAVALLGQKQLSLHGELLFFGVLGDHAVEASDALWGKIRPVAAPP